MGILKFVKAGFTSRSCPNCENAWNKKCGEKCSPKCPECEENDIYEKWKN
jgi:hypothetical protein